MSAMDGALWTIKVEVSFYVLVPVIVWLCRRLNVDVVLWALFIASIAFRIVFAKHEKLVIQIPGQLSYFIMGGLIYYHLKFFTKYGKWILPAALLCVLVHYKTGWQFLGPLSIPPLTLGIALLLPVVKGPARWGDFSYGTYVLHFPIIQVLISFGIFSAHPWLGVLLTLTIVAILAAFSWFFVEKPSLDHAHARAQRLKPSFASL
jgi:peptidoglycan/LPS O-acetylase OafA/YrhL